MKTVPSDLPTRILSTGESKVTQLSANFDEVLNEIAVLSSKEVVVASDFDGELQKKMRERDVLAISFEDNSSVEMKFSHLLDNLNQDKLKQTTARLFNYLYRSQKRSLDHLQPVTTYQIHQYMKIDYYSKRNLELTETIRSKGKKGSLLWLLDETMTAMGGRMLKTWIDRPLISREEIEQRQTIVEVLMNNYFERQELREKLTEVYDLERLAGRVAFGNVNARDLSPIKAILNANSFLKTNSSGDGE